MNSAIVVRADGGTTRATLLEGEVSQNILGTATLELTACLNRDLTIKLVSSSRGNDSYDWLPVALDLIAARRAVGELASQAGDFAAAQSGMRTDM